MTDTTTPAAPQAPERIWAFYTPDDFDDSATITAYEAVQYGGQEYVRADLYAAATARAEAAVARVAELEAAMPRAWEAGRDAAANVEWWRGNVNDNAPTYLSDWQRGLVSGQFALRSAALALTPPDDLAEGGE